MKKVLLLLLLLTAYAAGAQQILGRVTDIRSNPVAGATIHLLNTNEGTFSDSTGRFSLHATPGKYQLEVSAIGYASLSTWIEAGKEETTIALQESATHLDAVVVTAQKQEEDIQKIPSSVTALSAKQVLAYRLWNVQELTAIAPNLYSADPGDNRNITSIRGITSTSYDPSVATYVDGVNQFSLDTYIPQLFDVERIEVLRGPQGTLYGRNAMGGVINVITRQPTNVTKGFVEITSGNHGLQRYSGGLSVPLINDKLFLGIAGLLDKTDGYFTNTYNNTHFDKRQNITGNYYLKYRPAEKWLLTLNVKHSNNTNNGPFTLAGSVADALGMPFQVSQNSTARMTDNLLNTSLTIANTGRKLNFTSLTTYQSNYRFYDKPLDGDFSPFDFYSIINNYGKSWNTVKVFTQEFKLTSPAASSSCFHWTAGSYFYHQSSPVKQATRFGADAAPIAGDSLFSIISTTRATSKGLAFFGQTKYAVSPRLDVTAGLRYDYEQKWQSVLGEYQHDPNPNPQFVIRPDTSASVSFGSLSPKLSVLYKASEANALFLNYSRGFRTGGLTAFSSDPSSPPLYSFKPEYSNNFEMGFRNEFLNNRIKVNANLFYIHVNNAQVPSLVLPQAFTITRNAGNLVTKGAELELAAAIVKGFHLEYNLGIVNATYKTLLLPSNGTVADRSGNKQLFTPSATSMTALQYTLASASHWKLSLRGEWKYIGLQFFDLANQIRQPGYNLINLRAGVEYKNYSVYFWTRNLTNKHYIAYAYDFGATHLGNPKTAGVTFRVGF